jgi:hypothetical protein
MQSKGGEASVQNPARTSDQGEGAREDGSAVLQPERPLLLREHRRPDVVLMGTWVGPSGSLRKQIPPPSLCTVRVLSNARNEVLMGAWMGRPSGSFRKKTPPHLLAPFVSDPTLGFFL